MNKDSIEYIKILQNKTTDLKTRVNENFESNKKTILDYLNSIDDQKKEFENYLEEVENIQNNILEITEEDLNILREDLMNLKVQKQELKKKAFLLQKKIALNEPQFAHNLETVLFQPKKVEKNLIFEDLKKKAENINALQNDRKEMIKMEHLEKNFRNYQKNLLNVDNIENYESFVRQQSEEEFVFENELERRNNYQDMRSGINQENDQSNNRGDNTTILRERKTHEKNFNTLYQKSQNDFQNIFNKKKTEIENHDINVTIDEGARKNQKLQKNDDNINYESLPSHFLQKKNNVNINSRLKERFSNEQNEIISQKEKQSYQDIKEESFVKSSRNTFSNKFSEKSSPNILPEKKNSSNSIKSKEFESSISEKILEKEEINNIKIDNNNEKNSHLMDKNKKEKTVIFYEHEDIQNNESIYKNLKSKKSVKKTAWDVINDNDIDGDFSVDNQFEKLEKNKNSKKNIKKVDFTVKKFEDYSESFDDFEEEDKNKSSSEHERKFVESNEFNSFDKDDAFDDFYDL